MKCTRLTCCTAADLARIETKWMGCPHPDALEVLRLLGELRALADDVYKAEHARTEMEAQHTWESACAHARRLLGNT